MRMKEMSGNSKESRYFEVDTVFEFGKYEGLTFKEVFAEDPGYLIWIYENFSNTDYGETAELLITMAYDGEVGIY